MGPEHESHESQNPLRCLRCRSQLLELNLIGMRQREIALGLEVGELLGQLKRRVGVALRNSTNAVYPSDASGA